MFIVDSAKKEIYHFDGNLKKIKGDFVVIKKNIESKIQKTALNENFFINTMLCNNKFDDTKDTIIIDLYRKKELYITSKTITNFGGIDRVLKLYFSFKKNEKVKVVPVDAFGQKVSIFKKIKICSQKKLIQKSFILKTSKNRSGFFVSYCYFPYALGTYEANQGFITNVCKGANISKKIAEKKAISEAIERLSASLYTPYLGNKFNKNIKPVITPYMDEKWYIKKEKSIIYDKISSITDREKKLCPLDILYYPYLYSFPCISNSNGMATHLTMKQAVQSALFELIERDAYILMWLLKKGAFKLENSSLTGNIYKEIFKIEKIGFKLHIFIIKFDNPIPVCLIILEKNNKNIVIMGTGENIESSIGKALEECSSSIGMFSKKGKTGGITLQHINYYLQKCNSTKLDWLKNLHAIKYEDCDFDFLADTSTKNIVEYYKNLNIKFFVYKYKNDINKAFGRYTVRIISEDLLPIYFGNLIPPQILDSKRLKSFQKKLNVNNINMDLHPLG